MVLLGPACPDIESRVIRVRCAGWEHTEDLPGAGEVR